MRTTLTPYGKRRCPMVIQLISRALDIWTDSVDRPAPRETRKELSILWSSGCMAHWMVGWLALLTKLGEQVDR